MRKSRPKSRPAYLWTHVGTSSLRGAGGSRSPAAGRCHGVLCLLGVVVSVPLFADAFSTGAWLLRLWCKRFRRPRRRRHELRARLLNIGCCLAAHAREEALRGRRLGRRFHLRRRRRRIGGRVRLKPRRQRIPHVVWHGLALLLGLPDRLLHLLHSRVDVVLLSLANSAVAPALARHLPAGTFFFPQEPKRARPLSTATARTPLEAVSGTTATQQQRKFRRCRFSYLHCLPADRARNGSGAAQSASLPADSAHQSACTTRLCSRRSRATGHRARRCPSSRRRERSRGFTGLASQPCRRSLTATGSARRGELQLVSSRIVPHTRRHRDIERRPAVMLARVVRSTLPLARAPLRRTLATKATRPALGGSYGDFECASHGPGTAHAPATAVFCSPCT